jgi:hypothetical protein
MQLAQALTATFSEGHKLYSLENPTSIVAPPMGRS